jgi:predicted ATP-dependent endonuclease of OLD family
LGNQPPALSASLAKIGSILQPTLAEMFFTQRLILVEGIEDAAYINAWLVLTDKIDEFRRAGCHVVPVDGKSELLRPVIIAEQMGIPVHVVFDADADKFGEKEKHRQLHERDNRSLLLVLGGEPTNLFPDTCVSTKQFTMWPRDLGQSVQNDLRESLGDEVLGQITNEAHARFGNGSGLKKNAMLIKAKLALAVDRGGKSPSLDGLCAKLIEFGVKAD